MIVAEIDSRTMEAIEWAFFRVPHCDGDTVPDCDQIQELLAEYCTSAMGLDWVNQYKGPSDAAAMILALRLLKQIRIH